MTIVDNSIIQRSRISQQFRDPGHQGSSSLRTSSPRETNNVKDMQIRHQSHLSQRTNLADRRRPRQAPSRPRWLRKTKVGSDVRRWCMIETSYRYDSAWTSSRDVVELRQRGYITH